MTKDKKQTGKFFMMRTWVATMLFLCVLASNAKERYVDYRFAPKWAQSTTAFPDDSYKTLVGPQGQLLYEFGDGEFFQSIGTGFKTVIHMMADENQKYEQCAPVSPRVPVVTLTSVLGKDKNQVKQCVFSTTQAALDGRAISNPIKSDREDVVVSKFINTSGKAQTIHPIVVVNSKHKVTVGDRIVTIDSAGHFFLSVPVARVRQNLIDFKTVIELEPQEVPAGDEFILVGLYDNGLPSQLATRLTNDPSVTVREVPGICKTICNYWENQTDIPYGHITVPDQDIQNLIDASVRGIWQAREIIDGNISLQVGPTCYRGLWLVDGAFLSEASAMLGAGKDARAGIEYGLSFQKKDGGFRKLSPTFWKENGLVQWTCVRHAMLTQDKQWLNEKWFNLSRTVDNTIGLTNKNHGDSIPEDDGLIPPGFIDGGLNGGLDIPEYSNTLWNLAGIKAMISAAQWLGKKNDARKWQQQYDKFYATFRKAAARDMATDDFGNRYLNNMMKPEQRDLPQRAQWAFCQSIYPGQVFEIGDSIAVGTMKMLETTLQEGMVMGTGWMPEGIWNYFASFYGHAWLWNGEGEKAADALYAFANHASEMHNWREEHNPRDIDDDFYIGDMPHNWASAEFIRLACHMLQLDRGTELHMLEGIPEEWLGAGMKTALDGIATPFGPLSFTLTVDNTGQWADFEISPLATNCTSIVVHTNKWGTVQGKNIVKLNPKQTNKLKIQLTK